MTYIKCTVFGNFLAEKKADETSFLYVYNTLSFNMLIGILWCLQQIIHEISQAIFHKWPLCDHMISLIFPRKPPQWNQTNICLKANTSKIWKWIVTLNKNISNNMIRTQIPPPVLTHFLAEKYKGQLHSLASSFNIIYDSRSGYISLKSLAFLLWTSNAGM